MEGCTSSFNQLEDGISGLPDDILIAILSLLTLKEAACTSILSRRWRYLWRYITASFNFDSKILQTGKLEPTKYVSWVNEVLKLHLGTYIDEMRISFSFYGRYPRDIYDWIKFAMEKGVQRFELDVSPGFCITSYDFPSMEKFKFLFRTSQGHHVSLAVGSAGFCSLTSLRVVGVSITQEVLENLLANCPFLEQLGIVNSTSLLKSLKIAGPSLKLKCLEISLCPYLENLEISAMNLVSFTYIGNDINVPFKNIPLLSELSIGGEYCKSFVSGSRKHSSYIPQIEKLRLLSFQDFRRFPQYCELGNLKQVELFIRGHAGDSFLSFTSVLEAAPNLSKFSVQLIMYLLSKEGPKYRECWEVIRGDQSAPTDAEKEATKFHHQCLKVVQLVGFDGSSCSEIDLLLHLLEVATSLEKIIIDPSSPRGVLYSVMPTKGMEAARNRARQLKTRLPATVDLVIL